MKIITDLNYYDFVTNIKLPIILDFWAPWCRPCKMMILVLESIEKKYINKIIIAKCNIDENPELSKQFGITAIPTIVFLKNNTILNCKTGLISEPKMIEYCINYFKI